MNVHSFEVGQTVRLAKSALRGARPGNYEIVALMPEERGECHYRVRGGAVAQQRVVCESEISLAWPHFSNDR